MNSEESQVLEKLLLDLDENISEQLAPWLPGLNIFEVLKTSTTEIRHSNFIGWLLNPNESHGLGDYFFKKFCLKLIADNPTITERLGISVFNISLNSYLDSIVLREHKHIDLLFNSPLHKINLIIENKIFSDQHSNQLNRYQEVIEEDYPGYKNIFIFLTPEGNDSENEDWFSLGYNQILEILHTIIETKELSEKADILISDYIYTIRRNVVKDDELVKICNDIYFKHKQAIDLIIENKPDIRSESFDYITGALNRLSNEGSIIYNDAKSVKTIIRFRTPNMDNYFSANIGLGNAWHDGSPYYYEIYNKADSKIVVALIVYLGIESTVHHEQVNELLGMMNINSKIRKWKQIKKWDIHSFSGKKLEEWEPEMVSEKFDNFEEIFSKLLENKIVPFEEKILARKIES